MACSHCSCASNGIRHLAPSSPFPLRHSTQTLHAQKGGRRRRRLAPSGLHQKQSKGRVGHTVPMAAPTGMPWHLSTRRENLPITQHDNVLCRDGHNTSARNRCRTTTIECLHEMPATFQGNRGIRARCGSNTKYTRQELQRRKAPVMAAMFEASVSAASRNIVLSHEFMWLRNVSRNM